jgi:hypothetical protein
MTSMALAIWSSGVSDPKFEPFRDHKYISLETFMKNGQGVKTPVWTAMRRLARILFSLWAPHSGPRRARRACEGAERGVGVPASDRAGVWGGAPR